MKKRLTAVAVFFSCLFTLHSMPVWAETTAVDTEEEISYVQDIDAQTTEDSVQVFDIQMQDSPTEALPGNELWDEEMSATLTLACDWLHSSHVTDLYLTCLGASGKTAVTADVSQYITDLAEKTDNSDILELSYDILNVTFCGYNATNVLGKNLIDELEAYPDYADAGLYSIAYALLAVNSNDYLIPATAANAPEHLVKLLLDHQNADGGFNASIGGESNVVQTGLALAALSPFLEDENTSAAIDLGVDYLASMQQEDGSFPNDLPSSSIATAKVITALYCLGIPLSDERFVKNGETLQQVLLRYVRVDGGFCEYLGAESSDIATENVILALASIKRGHSPYQMDTRLAANTVRESQNVVVQEKQSVDLTNILLYILLGLLALTILLFLIISRFHPFQYLDYKESKAETLSDETEEPLQAEQEDDPIHRQ